MAPWQHGHAVLSGSSTCSMRGRCAGARGPAAGGVLLALLGGALLCRRLGLRLGGGERGLDLLEGEPQLVFGQPLGARPELHAPELLQQVLQKLDPLHQRVALGAQAVAL
jgi:hypothetical protein